MKIEKYSDFWEFYLSQHRHPLNRWLHVAGCFVGIASAPILFWCFGLTGILGALLVGYLFAWTGHLVVERNRPATWKYPLWSLISEFRMVGLIVTGRL